MKTPVTAQYDEGPIKGQKTDGSAATIVSFKSESGSKPPPKQSSILAPIAALFMLVSGTVNMQMCITSNNQVFVWPDGEKKFRAPFWQTFIGHAGAFFIISPFFFVDRFSTLLRGCTRPLGLSYSEAREKPFCPFYLWTVPAFFDLLTILCVNGSLIFIDAATARMLFAFNIVITAAIRGFWMKKVPTVYEIIGIVIALIGMFIAAIAAIGGKGAKSSDKPWVGVLLALSMAVISSMGFMIQEKMFAKYEASALEGATYVGLFGMTYDIILLGIGQAVGYEKTSLTFSHFAFGTSEATKLIIANIVHFHSIALFATSSQAVTKIGSSVLRALVNTARTPAIWLLGLALGKDFVVLQCIGMIFVILGITSYHYNFYVKQDCWRGDAVLRKELNCSKINCCSKAEKGEKDEKC